MVFLNKRAIQTDGSGAGLLFYHSAPDAGHLSFPENQRMGHSWTQQPQATLCPLRTDLIKLSWLLSHDVPVLFTISLYGVLSRNFSHLLKMYLQVNLNGKR